MSIGKIQAMLQYSRKFTHPINMIANQYSSILTALAGAERIFETMDHPNEIDEGGTSLSPDRVRGEIEFEDVHFGYVEDEPVLRGFALSVKAGQKIAIVGEIYTKYCRLGNWDLREYLAAESCQTATGGITWYALYYLDYILLVALNVTLMWILPFLLEHLLFFLTLLEMPSLLIYLNLLGLYNIHLPF